MVAPFPRDQTLGKSEVSVVTAPNIRSYKEKEQTKLIAEIFRDISLCPSLRPPHAPSVKNVGGLPVFKREVSSGCFISKSCFSEEKFK